MSSHLSSHPPMKKPKRVLSTDPPCDLVAARWLVTLAWRLHQGSARAQADESKPLKLTVDGPIRKSTSSTSRLCRIAATFPTLGLKRPGRGIPKDV
jgi:hypothetical protein